MNYRQHTKNYNNKAYTIANTWSIFNLQRKNKETYLNILDRIYLGPNFKPLVNTRLDMYSFNYIKEDTKNKINIRGFVQHAILKPKLKIYIITCFIARLYYNIEISSHKFISNHKEI